MPKRPILLVLAGAGVVLVAVLAAFFLRQPRAAWRFSPADASAVGAVGEFRRVTLTGPGGSFDALCTVFDPDAVRMNLVDMGLERRTSLRPLLDDEKALLVINGGYFDPQLRPVGLLRIDKQELSAFVDRPPFSGCVIIDDAGRASVVPARDPAVATAPSAMQAGPFLVDPGGRLGIHTDDGTPAERTAIATDGSRLCLIVTTPVTLRHLAECLVEQPAAFGLRRTDRALNLDGGPSTGLAVRTANDLVVREPRGRVRTILVIKGK